MTGIFRKQNPDQADSGFYSFLGCCKPSVSWPASSGQEHQGSLCLALTPGLDEARGFSLQSGKGGVCVRTCVCVGVWNVFPPVPTAFGAPVTAVWSVLLGTDIPPRGAEVEASFQQDSAGT